MELADTKLQSFEPERYRDISLNDLVMYAVYVLAEMQNEINTEEIVAACFLLFPERFHLRGYPSPRRHSIKQVALRFKDLKAFRPKN